jgi:hypothetical protein
LQDNDVAGWGALFRRLGVVPFIHVCPTPPHTSSEANAALSSLSYTPADFPRLLCIARNLSMAWESDYARFMQPDSDFGKLLCNTRWLVGSDEQAHVPSDLWWCGMKESLMGDNVAKVTPVVCEPMARALGVRFDVTVEALVEAIQSWIEHRTEISMAHMHRYAPLPLPLVNVAVRDVLC